MKRTKTEVGNLQTVLRRMRESASITMRQAGGIVGISHVAISQFENGKLNLPAYRIDQLVRAYGFSKEEFQKIVGRGPAINHRDDCHSIIDRLTEEQVARRSSLVYEPGFSLITRAGEEELFLANMSTRSG